MHQSHGSAKVRPTKLWGWLHPLLRVVLVAMTKPSEIFLGSRMTVQQKVQDQKETRKRAVRVDTFVAFCVVLGVGAYLFVVFGPPHFKWVAVTFALWRIIDISATAARITLVDRFEAPAPLAPFVASHARIVLLGIINYLEFWICFGTLYAAASCSLAPHFRPSSDWFAALYFSAITQLTIGYGDIQPLGLARVAVVAHSLLAMLLLILLLGRFVSVLRPERSLDDPPPKRPVHRLGYSSRASRRGRPFSRP